MMGKVVNKSRVSVRVKVVKLKVQAEARGNKNNQRSDEGNSHFSAVKAFKNRVKCSSRTEFEKASCRLEYSQAIQQLSQL